MPESQQNYQKFDVAIIGMGVFGSCVAWSLAKRGLRVFGCDQFNLVNDQGSSHGNTRLLRTLSQNNPRLYSLSVMSRDLWQELEEASGERLFEPTGSVVVGPQDGQLVVRAQEIAEVSGRTVEILSAQELKERHRAFSTVGDHVVGIVDELGGVLHAERCVAAAQNQAVKHGAVLQAHFAVETIDCADDGFAVTSGGQKIHAAYVVVATGAWSASLIPELPAVPERIPQVWYTFKGSSESFTVEDLPPFQWELDDNVSLWGHGECSGYALAKIGTHGNLELDRTVDINNLDRKVHPVDVAFAKKVLSTAMPEIDPEPADSRICLLTQTPDEQFLVGPLRSNGIHVATGGSGQGFKHGPAVGEIIAAQICGEQLDVETAFISPSRFGL